MPPRQSTSNSSSRQPRSTPQQQQPIATSSKVTLDDIPTFNVPDSITYEYVEPEERVHVVLSPEDQEKLVNELVSFQPRKLLDDITEHARNQPYAIVDTIISWARPTLQLQSRGPEYERELESGSYALETLLVERVDSVFDKFVAYALRNAFVVPEGLELVLPWHKGLDFDRGQHVTTLPKGEETLVERLQELRTKVEQARLLNNKLIEAENMINRRLDIALQRKAEVGFVTDVLESAGLSPLPEKAESLNIALKALHTKLSPLEPAQLGLPPSTSISAAIINNNDNTSVPGRPGVKAWELGRQAYLNWAVGKMLHPTSATGTNDGKAGVVGGDGAAEGPLEIAEKEMAQVGSTNNVEAISKHL